MSQLSFGLVLLWGFTIITTIFVIAYIDSYDCSQFENGWDKVCLDNNELHKSRILQTVTIAIIIMSALLIILSQYNTKEDKKE